MPVADGRTEALVHLQHAGIGKKGLLRLEARVGPVETWFFGKRDVVLQGAGIPESMEKRILDRVVDAEVDRGLRWLSDRAYEIVPPESVPGMTELPDPPLRLFTKGKLGGDRGTVSIVGARQATAYGLRSARRLAAGLAGEGVAVVSGLARGVDAAAHFGAVDAGGVTVAVLGSGPDVVYPAEHSELLHRIEATGGVLTEYLPGTPPLAHHFPRRNRLLVAISKVLLVVEARVQSGSFTSVKWALDLGREVAVVPGPVDHPLGEGVLILLREGATPVGEPQHVLELLGLDSTVGDGGAGHSRIEGAAPTGQDLSVPEGRLFSLLGSGPVDLDELVRASGESPGRILSLLLALEVKGRVVRDAMFRYAQVGDQHDCGCSGT